MTINLTLTAKNAEEETLVRDVVIKQQEPTQIIFEKSEKES